MVTAGECDAAGLEGLQEFLRLLGEYLFAARFGQCVAPQVELLVNRQNPGVADQCGDGLP